eukprot:4386558-Amphidinium_carterae.1
MPLSKDCIDMRTVELVLERLQAKYPVLASVQSSEGPTVLLLPSSRLSGITLVEISCDILRHSQKRQYHQNQSYYIQNKTLKHRVQAITYKTNKNSVTEALWINHVLGWPSKKVREVESHAHKLAPGFLLR